MKSILDPSFRYRSSVHTDLKKTFARIRREQKKKQQSDRVAQSASNLHVLRTTSRTELAK
jgi:hypothetical protein